MGSTTGDTLEKLLNTLTRFDLSGLSAMERRVFRTNAKNYLTYLQQLRKRVTMRRRNAPAGASSTLAAIFEEKEEEADGDPV